jgi:NADPH:quinone reductase-like Zn-dependent oxidoreductase
VYGATGGIGSAAVQILRSMDATVTAVCGTEHVELVRSLGADKVVDYQTSDFTVDDVVYDVVLDAVGKSTFAACRPLLKPGGIYSSSELGPKGQNPLLALTTPLLRGKKVLFPIPRQEPAMATYIQGLMAAGKFLPVVDRRYPLEDIVAAYRYVESGRKIGNVVITVTGGSP